MFMKTAARKTPRRAHRNIWRTAAIFLGAGLMLGIAPASAFAATTHTETVAASNSVATSTYNPQYDPSNAGTQGADSIYILINRWGDAATKLHTRVNNLDVGQLATTTINKSTVELGLGLMNVFWQGTTGLSDFSSNMTPIRTIGLVMDQGAAALGDMVMNNGVIFVLAGLVGILGAVWNKARGRDGSGLVKQIISVSIVFAVIAVMTAGAHASKNDASGNYVPGTASPGWVIFTLDDVISKTSNAVLSGVTTGANSFTADSYKSGSTQKDMSCDAYSDAIKNQFNAEKATGTAAAVSISGMWETAGLTTWIKTQFGTTQYAKKVWCHQLEMTRGTTAQHQAEFAAANVAGGTQLLALAGKTRGDSAKAFYTDNETDQDQSLIAWAACQWNGTDAFTVDKSFEWGTQPISPRDCMDWWSGTQGTNLSAFDLGTGGGGAKQVQELSDNGNVIDFVHAWQGRPDGSDGFVSVFWGSIAALIMWLVLGVALSVTVVIAKLLGIISMSTVLLVLIGSLFTKDGPGPKITDLLRKVIGYSFLASGASLIVIVVTWLTKSLMTLGTTLPSGGPMQLIWAAMSPVLALISLHFLFKKFKIQSPLTPKGALAWGAGAGLAGGAVGAGIASRLANRGVSAAAGAGKGVLHKVTGGKLGEPMGVGGKTRDGAGAPGKDPKLTIGKNPDGISATKQERAAALAHASQTTAPPRNAIQRADAAARAVGRAAVAAPGAIVQAPGKIRDGVRAIPGSVKGLDTRIMSGFEQVHKGALSATSGLRHLGKDNRELLRTIDKENFAETALGQAAAAKKAEIGAKLVERAQQFKEAPISSTWQVAKGVGNAAKVTAKVAGVGMIVTATGGLAAVPVAAHYARKMHKASVVKKDERALEQVSAHRDHLATEKLIAADQAKELATKNRADKAANATPKEIDNGTA